MVAVLLAVYLLGSVLLPVGISVVIAYVLLPVAKLLERLMPWRRRHPVMSRGIAIGVIFVVVLGILAGFLALATPITIQQSQKFAAAFPGFFNSAVKSVETWVAEHADLIPLELRDLGEEAYAGASNILKQAILNLISKTWDVISGSFAFIIGLATAPVLIFYMMKDSGKIKSSLCLPFPGSLRPHMESILDIADQTVGRYIRGQLTLGLIVGVIVAVGLALLGVPFAVVLGIVAGLTELVPIVGPWIGGAAGVLVTLATDPGKVLWVILLYLGVQLAENALLVPRIQGNTLRLHPIAVILVITIGSQFFGLWGVILGPPLVAMGKDIIVYMAGQWDVPALLPEAQVISGADELTGGEPEPAEDLEED